MTAVMAHPMQRMPTMRSPFALYAVASLAIVLLAIACDSGFTRTPVASECTVSPPPDPPDAGAPVTLKRSVFAMTKLFIARDRTGTYPPNAWKQYGLNVDAKVTTKDSTDVCRLATGAARSTQADGCIGIDNSFAVNIFPIIQTGVGQEAEALFDASLGAGVITNLITIDGLESARDATGLRAALLLAGPSAGHSASWTQDARSFADGGAPSIAFDRAFVTRGVFVASPPSGSGLLTIGSERGIDFTSPATHVQIVATLSPDGTALTNGVIAGILPVEAFVAAARRIGPRVRSSLCQGSAFDSIAQQFRQGADILVDGTHDPNRDCDGISFGMGFDAHLTTLGPIATSPPEPDGCAPDAGSDAADGAADAVAD